MSALQRCAEKTDRPCSKLWAGLAASAKLIVAKTIMDLTFLHGAASRVAGLDMKFLPGEGGLSTDAILDAAQQGAIETVYLMGADELDTSKLKDAS